MLKSHLRSQVKQTPLPKWKPWLPLFEAVMNSVQAIKEENKPAGEGQILIEIERERSLADQGDAPIHAFKVTDNGIGMDDDNFDSFNTSYSVHKEELGGKGLGRFVWLRAFEKVEIDTTFIAPEDGVPQRRDFTFDLDYDADKVPYEPAPGRATGTVVHLIGLKEPFKSETARTTDQIVERLVEHFLLYLYSGDCPSIIVQDYGLKQSVNKVWEKDYKTFATEHAFAIDDVPFTMHGFRLTTPRVAKHKPLYAANQRAVVVENLDKFVPNLNRRLPDEHDNTFVYLGIVESPFLSEHVNPARSGFDLEGEQEDDDSQLEFDLRRVIKRTDIREKCIAHIQSDLSKVMRSINEQKEERIREFVQTDAPQYKILLKYTGQFIDKISPTASKAEIDTALHREIFQRESKLRSESMKIIREAQKLDNYEEYRAKLSDFMENYNELGASALARYVGHRKIILDFLDSAISKEPEAKKFPLERAVHHLVFPMKTTSDDLPYHQQNLWVIDEALNFHSYIASDMRLDGHDSFESDSEKRPDLFIYDRRIVFGEGEKDHPISSITVVEFKRPQRNDYTYEDNPVTQSFELVRKIRSGQFKTTRGRPIVPSNTNVPAFCYIISDITPTLVEVLDTLDALPTPEGQGYYGFQKKFGIYYEVTDYDKLLSDARKRNRVFMEKLNFAADG